MKDCMRKGLYQDGGYALTRGLEVNDFFLGYAILARFL